jgi:hypothetical protein
LEAATVGSGEQPILGRFHSDTLLALVAAAYSMAKVKLGSKEFDVNAEKIYANRCGVPAADLALFAARVKTGEISRVKMLYLDLVRCSLGFLLLMILRFLLIVVCEG